MKTSKALITSAVAGLIAAGFSLDAAAQAGRRHREVLRRRQERPERLRHRDAFVLRQGRRRTTTPTEWKTVAKGTCEKMGGKLTARRGRRARRRPPRSPTCPAAADARARAPDASHAGIGLRAPHYAELARAPAARWRSSRSTARTSSARAAPPLAWLERFRADYPLSLHGVGLSLGSADPARCGAPREAAPRSSRRFEPALVSEHLCWASIGGRHANDLLPLPYTEEALAHVVARIGEVQERLGRADPGRERLVVPRVRGFDDSRVGVRRRGRARARAAASCST